MQCNPYLGFDGACREAFEFYARVLGGTIQMMMTNGESPAAAQLPKEAHGRIMHARLTFDGQTLMGADAPPGHFSKPAGFCVALHVDSTDRARKIFDALSENGQVQMPFQPTFWAKGFGMAIDRFGTPWIVNGEEIPLS